MFSYTQQTIDEDVDRFVNNTSGPLRDMMSQGQNTENLKLLFRDTNASAEAVVNGAALEGEVDTIADRADVLVAVRVTLTDLDGNNAPSKPYRLRVTVAEDDNGHMSFYRVTAKSSGTARTRTSSRRHGSVSWSARPIPSAWECWLRNGIQGRSWCI